MPYSDKKRQAQAVKEYRKRYGYTTLRITVEKETRDKFARVSDREGGDIQALRWLLRGEN